MAYDTHTSFAEDLAHRIEQLVWIKTSGAVRNLRVEVCSECVVLSGRTDTYYAKQLATQAVLDEVDDLPLTNDIVVC